MARLDPRDSFSAMAPKPKQPHGPPMPLGDTRELGVQRLVASCLNDACRHPALISAGRQLGSQRDGETETPDKIPQAGCQAS
jgi:hypothetical protein